MKTIICPNCGAENSQSKKCEYCGTMLKCVNTTDSASRKKQTSAEDFAEKIAKYKKVEPFMYGVAVVSIGELYGVINENGDLIIPLTEGEITNYKGRLLNGILSGNKIYDTSGNILVEANTIEYIKNGDFLLKHDDGKQLIFDINNQIIPISLPENVRIYESLGGGYYIIKDLNNKNLGYNKGVINLIKQTIILEPKYAFIELEENGKLGFYKRGLFNNRYMTIQL